MPCFWGSDLVAFKLGTLEKKAWHEATESCLVFPADDLSGHTMPLEKTLVPAGAELLASFTGPDLCLCAAVRVGVDKYLVPALLEDLRVPKSARIVQQRKIRHTMPWHSKLGPSGPFSSNFMIPQFQDCPP